MPPSIRERSQASEPKADLWSGKQGQGSPLQSLPGSGSDCLEKETHLSCLVSTWCQGSGRSPWGVPTFITHWRHPGNIVTLTAGDKMGSEISGALEPGLPSLLSEDLSSISHSLSWWWSPWK